MVVKKKIQSVAVREVNLKMMPRNEHNSESQSMLQTGMKCASLHLSLQFVHQALLMQIKQRNKIVSIKIHIAEQEI
ncbi:hypothetical protein T05_8603 [Trichinella murrelli]|uniref:Uncharacterized protein n=1 Tax=Trichinella murrelli TaxID=144512 RepID=A0A0V0TNA1_9BILA|nr:hypothetical protein T05_8603 [Trichinella murrelli]